MLPWLVTMLALTVTGVVGILPVCGGLTGLTALSAEGEYWQLVPRLADGLNGGIGAAGGVDSGGVVLAVELASELAAELFVVVAAVLLFWSFLALITAITTPAMTAAATTTPPTITSIRRRLAWMARRSTCRSSLRFAAARRCSLVGTAGIPPWLSESCPSFGLSCQPWLAKVAAATRVKCFIHRSAARRGSFLVARIGRRRPGMGNWNRVDHRISAGLLQRNCDVLADRPGSDAVIVDPGQRVMGQLRHILDENRLTPAAVLLTHGHIDHMWSAQKVSDTYGCPTYIHPEDRFMLKDPIYGLVPRLAQMAAGVFFREPRQVVELDRDGDKLDLGSVTVNVDHAPGHTRGSVIFRVSCATKDDKGLASPATPCSSAVWAAPTCSVAADATC